MFISTTVPGQFYWGSSIWACCNISHICSVWQLKKCPSGSSINKSAHTWCLWTFFHQHGLYLSKPDLLGLWRFKALKVLSNWNCKSDLGTALLASSYLLVSKVSINGNFYSGQKTQEATKPFTVSRSMVTGECKSSYSPALLPYWLIWVI